jgi:hypothetical protein
MMIDFWDLGDTLGSPEKKNPGIKSRKMRTPQIVTGLPLGIKGMRSLAYANPSHPHLVFYIK